MHENKNQMLTLSLLGPFGPFRSHIQNADLSETSTCKVRDNFLM